MNDDFFEDELIAFLDDEFDDFDEYLEDDLQLITESNETPKIEETVLNTRIKLLESYRAVDAELGLRLSQAFDVLQTRESQKKSFKKWFFIVIMFMFCILSLAPLILVFYFKNLIDSMSIILTIIAYLIELIASIMILPKIIADYLFNKEEDREYMEIIHDLEKYHEDKKKYLEK